MRYRRYHHHHHHHRYDRGDCRHHKQSNIDFSYEEHTHVKATSTRWRDVMIEWVASTRAWDRTVQELGDT